MKRLLRPFFNKAASSLGIPEVQKRINRLEEHISPSGITPNLLATIERRATDLAMAQLTPLREELSTASAHAENRLASLNEALVAYVDAKQLQNSEATSAFLKEQSEILAEFRRSLDALRRQLSSTSVVSNKGSNAITATESIISPIDDAMYVSLENHFRGGRDLVAERQRDYLPKLPTVISSSAPLIDLGCGRGEWLKVAKETGLPAIGVDSNAVCIAECLEENLEVVQEDILSFLRNRQDASVGAYTMFQVLEHLPFPILVEALREIRRTLVPGGRLIAEVPNAKNLRVSAGTFWIDPTHQRPLFPELLLFLASEVGFSQTESHYANNLSPEFDLSGLPDGAQQALQRVLEAIDGPGDFALIATA